MSTTTLQPTHAGPAVRAVVPPAVRAAARGASVRLTRRGRLVVFLLSFAVLVLAGVAFAAGSLASATSGAPSPTQVVVVGPGDTLWEIAAATGDGDVRGTVQQISELNGLDSGTVLLGQQLRVPLG